MRVYFIRHGIAVEREEFSGPDMERPLSLEGVKKTRQAFLGLKHIEKIENIFSSEALRAKMTAEILSKIYSIPVKFDSTLNPDMRPQELAVLLEKARKKNRENLALVGHEPDFSLALQELCGANIQVKKASCIAIDTQAMCLTGLYPPAILRKIEQMAKFKR